MRKKWLLVLAVVVGLGTALLGWFAAEDARQGAALDARVVEAQIRSSELWDHVVGLRIDGAPEVEIVQAKKDALQARDEAVLLAVEQGERRRSWHARLRAEVRRRTGW